MIFPGGHPAIPFLLLLAIADDALGLIILALFYPSGELSFIALVGLMTAAVLLAVWLRRRRTHAFWPYVIGPGSLSWAALYLGGFHPALALVPIVPFMPHGPRDLGLFDPREALQTDTLNQFEHWWATPVQFVLLFFGFANAGVPFGQIGPGTYYVLAALLFGKPIGILLFFQRGAVDWGAAPARPALARSARCRNRRRNWFHGLVVFCDRRLPRGKGASRDENGCASELRRRSDCPPLLAVCEGTSGGSGTA